MSFQQLGRKLVQASPKNRTAFKTDIPSSPFLDPIESSTCIASRGDKKEFKFSKLLETHHVPTKFHKLFEKDEARNEMSTKQLVSRPKQAEKRKKPIEELIETADQSKKQRKASEIITNLLEESGKLANAIRFDEWEISRFHHTNTKAMVYFKIKDIDMDASRKQDLVQLIMRFQPAVQKAFNARFLTWKWTLNRKELPRIYFRHDESFIRSEKLNALLDEIERAQTNKVSRDYANKA